VTRLPVISAGHTNPVPDAWWVKALQRAGLVVYPALILFGLVRPALAGRILWTVSIAALPLFFVLAGYHRWRRICPLAFFSQLPALLGRAGQRRAGPWLQTHGYRMAFGIFLVSLWLRLVATNGDGYAIALFLTAIAMAALATGLVFTGKTWCNYVCPVYFVEKLYTEPRGLRDTPNSLCHPCTACKACCPDINEENNYWKEILLPDKRYVFYAFPGVVLAFYVYYFVQAGNWEYYFGGRWTHEVGLVRTAFLPGADGATAGVYFWPAIPRAVAAAVTLALGGLVSFALFSFIERRVAPVLKRRDGGGDATSVRHVTFSLAAFTAFIAFYSFAGAPTLRLVAGAPHVFQLLVMTTATLFLVRRIVRRQRDFSEETLARTIIAKWPWTDTPPPRDLHEAFLVHSIRSKTHGDDRRASVLHLYKSAVRESLNSGVVSHSEVRELKSVRDDLRITEADHERVLTELVEEDRALAADGGTKPSAEKQLQLDGYARAVAALLDASRTTGRGVDDAVLQRLRHEYAVTEDEHRQVLDGLMQRGDGIASYILDTPHAIEELAAAIRAIEPAASPVTVFLTRLLKRRWSRAVDLFLQALADGEPKTAAWREALLSSEPSRRQAAIRDLGARLSPETGARMSASVERASNDVQTDPQLALRAQLQSADPYVRATALYVLQSHGGITAADREGLAHDDHPVVREILDRESRATNDRGMPEPSILEKMIALCTVKLFDTLEPEELVRLAESSQEAWFAQGERLCQQGDVGDEAFIVLAGEVSVFKHDDTGDRLVGVEGVGTCIGELSVLDPAPRASTVIVSSVAVRALRVSGQALRDAREASPAVADGIIRLLVRRLRGDTMPASAATPTPAQRR
jgi:cyclic nucleotide-binding protein